MLARLSVWSKVQTCIWPSGFHCHSLSLASVKSRLVLPFWYRPTRVVLVKGPLNVCVCVCVRLGLEHMAAIRSGFWRLYAVPVAKLTPVKPSTKASHHVIATGLYRLKYVFSHHNGDTQTKLLCKTNPSGYLRFLLNWPNLMQLLSSSAKFHKNQVPDWRSKTFHSQQ